MTTFSFFGDDEDNADDDNNNDIQSNSGSGSKTLQSSEESDAKRRVLDSGMQSFAVNGAMEAASRETLAKWLPSAPRSRFLTSAAFATPAWPAFIRNGWPLV